MPPKQVINKEDIINPDNRKQYVRHIHSDQKNKNYNEEKYSNKNIEKDLPPVKYEYHQKDRKQDYYQDRNAIYNKQQNKYDYHQARDNSDDKKPPRYNKYDYQQPKQNKYQPVEQKPPSPIPKGQIGRLLEKPNIENLPRHIYAEPSYKPVNYRQEPIRNNRNQLYGKPSWWP